MTTLSCVGPDALKRVRDSCNVFDYRPVQPAGHRHRPTVRLSLDDGTPGRGLDRLRTGRDVLLREKCTPSADVDVRDPCRTIETDDIEARARTPRSDDESLRSFIRVSQVYP